MIFLPGYGIKEPIYLGVRNHYYLAERKKDGRSVTIKVPTGIGAGSGDKEIRRFIHEHDILRRLRLSGVPESYGLERYRGGYALILEALPGVCLVEWDGIKGLCLRDALAIGSKIAGILSGLHINQVIHQGIRPEAIFYASASSDVWLSDFDGASFSAELAHQIPQPKMAVEALSYLSPEQTGRMNRAVDFRTDFYSLGVTLYELVTGSLPFTGSDPLEIVHSHLARQPLPPREINALIPEMVSAILMKLLAKSPDDRYQSAWGLKADLDECLSQWEAKGDIVYFSLGSQDVPERFNLSQKLYGREPEKELLLKYVESLGDGVARMILVAGYSGIGKTSLVHEIRKPLAARSGYYIHGKFDPLHSDIPYSGLVQAFEDLADQILSESESQLQEWKDRLLVSLGENIRAVIDVIPTLELVTGPQPPLMELGADEAQNRFNHAFLAFMRVCCRLEHPVVIFLDDLQWVEIGRAHV